MPAINSNSIAARYGFAVVSGLAAFFLTRWAAPFFKGNFFDPFQAAIMLSAWFGGLGAGIVTVGISFAALDYFFIPPVHTFTLGMDDIIRLVIFAAAAVLTSSLSNRIRQANREIQRANDELESRIEERTEELSHANALLAMENASRLAAEKTILEISDREQSRLGQDLHDGLCQILAGIKLLSENIKEKFLTLSLPEAKDMEHIEKRLREALTQADMVSRGLYPVELEANGLMSALQEFCENISKVHGISCLFICRKPVLIHKSAIATHLYRIAQEAVINAIKGGEAKQVRVRLLISGFQTVLSVADDGIGLHNKSLRNGMGLKIMEYRANMINGKLVFYSRPRGGTVIRCSVHLTQTMGAHAEV